MDKKKWYIKRVGNINIQYPVKYYKTLSRLLRFMPHDGFVYKVGYVGNKRMSYYAKNGRKIS